MNSSLFDRTSPFGKLMLVLLVLASAFLAMRTIVEAKQYGIMSRGEPRDNVISVTGTGKVSATPDVAVLTFSVLEEGADVKTAQTKATNRANAAIKYLRDNGVEEKDIQTSGYNINPKYEYRQPICRPDYCPPAGQATIVGYQVSQTVTVKIRKIDTAGTILSGIGGLGVQNVSGLSFTLDDEEGSKQEAREKAIADAREKAKVLAKGLDVRLGRIVSFNESGSYPPVLYGKGAAFDTAAEGRGAAVAPAPDLPPGQNEIVSTVTIVYEIR
jgi:uncharacterized protein